MRTLIRFVLVVLAAAAGAAASHGVPPSERLILGRDLRAFRPSEALGAALDGTDRGGVDRILTPHNIAAMKSAGLGPLTYRLRTELGIEAWHWNPAGQWSDPARRQGYWTSSDRPRAPIGLSWGYRLPRRGDTDDQANDRDYSRLTDGDRSTFWKSNPYLDPAVLHDGLAHPQWLVVRFDRRRPIDAAVIDWGTPFAMRYQIQYWTGASEDDGDGRWVTFAGGRVTHGTGGRIDLLLADRPVTTSHVRILLEQGSGTAPAGAHDWRDRAGFAVREVSLGLRRADGSLDDAVVHAPSHVRQTFTHVSSTDPWHRWSDRDTDLEQPGIDRLVASGLGSGLPLMMPAGLLYDTPDNAAAELRYIARRHYAVARVELGEEPDGQYASAADYGALYLAAVDRIRGILPMAQIGGPSLQSAFTDTWMQPGQPHKWDGWLADYLTQRHRLRDMRFVSFEFYPFDDICGDISAKLIGQTALLDQAWAQLTRDGWPGNVPRVISEYGFSAYSGRVESDMPAAMLLADIAGQWTALGGDAAYLFGYPPGVPANQHLACAGYGNMMLFLADRRGQASAAMPSFYAARLLTRAWTQPGHGLHQVIETRLAGAGSDIAAFALRRPDRRISVLLANRSATRDHMISLPAAPGTTVYSYGPQQYAWADRGTLSRPLYDRPPAERRFGTGAAVVTLPPLTMAVALLD